MEKLSLDKKTLRKFGTTMGIILLALSAIILLKHKHSISSVFTASLVFFLLSFMAPTLLKPVYIFWMKLAMVLSWFNTRLILCIIFYLIFAPIGLAIRLFGVDLLDKNIEKNRGTYWKLKQEGEFNRVNYERQF